MLIAVSIFFLPSVTFSQTGNSSSSESIIDRKINSVYEGYYYSDLKKALQEFDKIAGFAGEHQLWHKQLEVKINMAWCASQHNNIDYLILYINESKELLRNKFTEIQKYDENAQLIVNLLHTSGIYYFTLYDNEKAISEFEKVINYHGSGVKIDSLSLSAAFTYIGDSYYRLQNFQEAENYFELALLWLPHHESFYEAPVDFNFYYAANQAHLGKCNFAQAKKDSDPGLLKQALTNFSRATKSLNPVFRQHLNLLTANYNRISQIFFEQARYDSALFYLNKTTQLLRSTDILMAETHIFSGNVFLKQKKWGAALEQYEKSLEVVNHYVKGPHYRKAEIAYRKGEVYALQEDYNKALEHYQQAITVLAEGFEPFDIYTQPVLQEVLSEKDLLQTFLLKGQAFFRLYRESGKEKDLEAALRTYKLAAELVDKMRNNFQSPEYKEYIASSSNIIYENAIEAAYAAYRHTGNPEYIKQGYFFAEKNKSRILLEAVKSSSLSGYANIPPRLPEKERNIQARLSFLNNELIKSKNAGDAGNVNILRKKIHEASRKKDLLTKTIRENYPDFYQLKYETRVAGIEEVQKSLAQDAAALEYFYGDSAVYIFGISRNRVSLTRYKPEDLPADALIQNFLSKIKNPPGLNNTPENYREFVRQSFFLYNTLVKPALDKLKKTRSYKELLIIPDGPLGYLPFEVLLTGTENSAGTPDYSRLSYLIRSQVIRYEFSGTLSLHEGQRKRSREIPHPYAGFAPAYETGVKASSGLPPLKKNREEVEKVSAMLQGISFLGKEASEKAFKTYAGQSNILHLSMHAQASDHNPLSSGLAFSSPGSRETKQEKEEKESAAEDGFLYLYELYNMSLKAELAILSACQTGGGKLSRGEGIISLGRAFKYAGCPNIVMSLWNASDHTTAGIMQSYSRFLLDGAGKGEALRQARLEYLSSADNHLSHPYYWSAFILLGDNQPVNTPPAILSFLSPQKPARLLVLITCAAFMAGVFYLIRRRRKLFQK